MSDGPHKSLPMRAGWKKFAERADKAAYDPEQVADLAIPALEGDWREEVAPHIDSLRKALGDGRQGLLFDEQRMVELEALKRLNPGAPLWHAIVECVALALANGRIGNDALLDGCTDALRDRGGRGVRYAEEHYLRKSNEPRTLKLRTRMQDGMARAQIEGMARRVLGLESESGSQPQKLKGLDDGVRL